MSSVPLMALRNSERRSDEAYDSDQISDEEDEPLESVLAKMKYRYGNHFFCQIIVCVTTNKYIQTNACCKHHFLV
jgi:hypothetical protein